MNRKERRASRKAIKESWRKCGGCTECCIGISVAPLNKPEGVACRSLKQNGCARYDTRPAVCRDFACLWLMRLLDDMPNVDDMRPDQLGVIFKGEYKEGFGTYIEAVVRDLATFNAVEDLISRVGERLGMPVGVRFPGNSDGFLLNATEDDFDKLNIIGASRRRLPLL